MAWMHISYMNMIEVGTCMVCSSVHRGIKPCITQGEAAQHLVSRSIKKDKIIFASLVMDILLFYSSIRSQFNHLNCRVLVTGTQTL